MNVRFAGVSFPAVGRWAEYRWLNGTRSYIGHPDNREHI